MSHHDDQLDPVKADRAELLQLYKIAVDEYRFEVQLNWNRMQYYFVFNGAITGLAGSLLNVESAARNIFSGLVFFLGIFVCLIGRDAIARGHRYYRNAVYKKTLIEDQLGLLRQLPGYDYERADLSIATTRGMMETSEILRNTQNWLGRSQRRRSVVSYFRAILVMLAIINAVGFAVALRQFIGLR